MEKRKSTRKILTGDGKEFLFGYNIITIIVIKATLTVRTAVFRPLFLVLAIYFLIVIRYLLFSKNHTMSIFLGKGATLLRLKLGVDQYCWKPYFCSAATPKTVPSFLQINTYAFHLTCKPF